MFDEKYPYAADDINDLDDSGIKGYDKLVYKWVNELIMGSQANPVEFFKCGYANPVIAGFPNVANWKRGKHPKRGEVFYNKIVTLVGNIGDCVITGPSASYLLYDLKHIPDTIDMLYSNGNIEFKQYINNFVIKALGKNYISHAFNSIGVCVIDTALGVEINICPNYYGDIVRALSKEFNSAYKFGIKLEDGGDNMICLALPSAIVSHLSGGPAIIDNWGLYDGIDPFMLLVEYEKMGFSIKLGNKMMTMLNTYKLAKNQADDKKSVGCDDVVTDTDLNTDDFEIIDEGKRNSSLLVYIKNKYTDYVLDNFGLLLCDDEDGNVCSIDVDDKYEYKIHSRIILMVCGIVGANKQIEPILDKFMIFKSGECCICDKIKKLREFIEVFN